MSNFPDFPLEEKYEQILARELSDWRRRFDPAFEKEMSRLETPVLNDANAERNRLVILDLIVQGLRSIARQILYKLANEVPDELWQGRRHS